ncbi:GntR family transcriptional regulator [Nocardioides sp. PD653]|nr:GntR family transcriptional regulator [Nocardioides sp. PD653-B2]GAW54823.1 GntR family transcriptional regulator [Nocardioides sp. PD653]
MAVTDSAIEKIKQMIVSGDLRPGDRLPREADLAERLGISRGSLREAVRALSMIHVLDVRQGDGTYVTRLDPGLLMDALGFVMDFHRENTVLHTLEVRRLLEPAATELAATTMPDADVQGLADLLNEMSPSSTSEDLMANDIEFHRRIAAGSGNPILASLLDSLSGQTQRARVWRSLTEESAIARTLAEHRSIQQAIAARQPHIASAWATVHIAGVEQWLREALSDT